MQKTNTKTTVASVHVHREIADCQVVYKMSTRHGFLPRMIFSSKARIYSCAFLCKLEIFKISAYSAVFSFEIIHPGNRLCAVQETGHFRDGRICHQLRKRRRSPNGLPDGKKKGPGKKPTGRSAQGLPCA